jgi:hypothetical protein
MIHLLCITAVEAEVAEIDYLLNVKVYGRGIDTRLRNNTGLDEYLCSSMGKVVECKCTQNRFRNLSPS